MLPRDGTNPPRVTIEASKELKFNQALKQSMMSITVQKPVRKLIRLFEENYGLLMRLLPELRHADFFLVTDHQEQPSLEVGVTERSPYTTTLELSKCFDGDGRLLSDLAMTVRIYHDAECAEVVAYQGCCRIPPSYLVVGDARYLRDDKRQVNRLLNEILQLCNQRGCLALIPTGCTSV